jgi:hypothetical protein
MQLSWDIVIEHYLQADPEVPEFLPVVLAQGIGCDTVPAFSEHLGCYPTIHQKSLIYPLLLFLIERYLQADPEVSEELPVVLAHGTVHVSSVSWDSLQTTDRTWLASLLSLPAPTVVYQIRGASVQYWHWAQSLLSE